MDFQKELNELKGFINELFDFLIKKQLGGPEENSSRRVAEIKADLTKTENDMQKKGIKNSIIQKSILLAKELINEIDM